MPKLPHLSGREIIRVLERLGFKAVRQNGSHVVMRSGSRGCVVPPAACGDPSIRPWRCFGRQAPGARS
jgi:predicted RNA binding protein YcfA (HicA-like mRNA interferase family)